MICIAVVENEQKDFDILNDYIGQFGRKHSQSFSVTWFHEALSFLSASEKRFDIVFMDIKLSEYMDGLEASRRFRKQNDASVLIFITNMAQYAIRGYEVDALDFVVKPVSYVSFEKKMGKALRHVKNAKETWLQFPTRNGVVQIFVNDIRYVEVTGHVLHFHTGKDVIHVGGSLSDTGAKLAEAGFSRCSNSFLVNLRYVDQIRASRVTVGGEELPISRSYRKSFMEDFVRRIGE